MFFISKCPTKREYGQVGQNGLATWGQLDMEISKVSRKKRIDWMSMLCARLRTPQTIFQVLEQANLIKGKNGNTCNRTTPADEEDRDGHVWRLGLVLRKGVERRMALMSLCWRVEIAEVDGWFETEMSCTFITTSPCYAFD
jgi:hypothetical protein